MFGKAKENPDDPYAWLWKGKSAKKHAKDDIVMTPAGQGQRGPRNGAPGRGFLRMSVPPGLPIRRRPAGGSNPYRTELGPGFRSGENIDRQLLGGQEMERCRNSHHSPGPLPPCCAPLAPRPPPALNRHPGPVIDRPSRRSPPDTYPARHHAMAPRGRPLSRQEYPPRFSPRSRQRHVTPRRRRNSPFVFPTPDDEYDHCYDFDSDGDSIYSDNSDLDSIDLDERFPSNRFDSNPFRPEGHRGRRGRRRGSYSDDDVLSGYSSDDLFDLVDRRNDRRFDRMGHRRGRGRAPHRDDFGPGYSGRRTTSSESRRNWFYPHRWD